MLSRSQDGLVTWAVDVPIELKNMTLQYFRSCAWFAFTPFIFVVLCCFSILILFLYLYFVFVFVFVFVFAYSLVFDDRAVNCQSPPPPPPPLPHVCMLICI
jgi:hypothetical protein